MAQKTNPRGADDTANEVYKDASVDSIYPYDEHDAKARQCWQAWADRLAAFAIDNMSMLKRKEAGNE